MTRYPCSAAPVVDVRSLGGRGVGVGGALSCAVVRCRALSRASAAAGMLHFGSFWWRLVAVAANVNHRRSASPLVTWSY